MKPVTMNYFITNRNTGMLKTGNRVSRNMRNVKHISCDGDRSYFPYLQVCDAAAKVNSLLANEEFYERIAEHPDFDMADISPSTIAVLMRKARLDMTIDLYYAVNPLKNIDGYDDLHNASVIHMNIWKIDRPVASLCNSIVHACVHAVNAFYDRCYFGHDLIPGMPIENTAPYAIGAIAECMISNEEKPFIIMEHDFFDVPKKGAREAAMISFG
jgi:hypothetical protein